ncbi:hypothetical protein SAMN05216391_11664 [Lachnospiraceae bacterium KHCPX20]|nr:hypothetical protein SAMN05216391_11664 [Lachnospiraceae bacterium KHCPX20]
MDVIFEKLQLKSSRGYQVVDECGQACRKFFGPYRGKKKKKKKVLHSYSSNQGNEVFFRWEAIFLFSRMYVGSWVDMQIMRIIIEI